MWGLEVALDVAAQHPGGSSGARMICPLSISTAMRPGRVLEGALELLYVIYSMHLFVFYFITQPVQDSACMPKPGCTGRP